MKQNIILSIVGPTAVGKTDLALQLTKLPFLQSNFAGFDIISADSRQVYKGLEIISGADIPEKFDDQITLHGISMIEPNQEWSLAHFRKFGQEIINESWQADRLPIIVGGTGLYHQHLFSTDQVINIQPNQEVRQKAELLTVEELKSWLKNVDGDRFSQMNQSDQNNPRRLVRAIEVALSPTMVTNDKSSLTELTNFVILEIGLTDSLANIQQKIEQRVKQRFQNGAIREVESLLTLDPPPTKSVLSTAGIREIQEFLQGSASETDAIAHWSRREFQYAKRQLTWWKKYGQTKWFDKQNPAWNEQVIEYLAHALSK